VLLILGFFRRNFRTLFSKRENLNIRKIKDFLFLRQGLEVPFGGVEVFLLRTTQTATGELL
jgi:hypothetical protein